MLALSYQYEDLLPESDEETVYSTLQKLEEIATKSVQKTIHAYSALAYSAGIDSSILATILRKEFGSATLLTLGTPQSSDIRTVAQDNLAMREGFRFYLVNISEQEIEKAAVEVSKIVTASNLAHFEDCVSFWLAASAASKLENLRFILSANGADELFCGYDRFRRLVDEQGYDAASKEICEALDLANKLLEQVGLVVGKFGFETREPFLDPEFVDYCLKIPIEYKILKGNDMLRKRIWRCLGRSLGVPPSTVLRQKKAMQYGMGVHAVTCSMLKHGTLKLEFSTSRNRGIA